MKLGEILVRALCVLFTAYLLLIAAPSTTECCKPRSALKSVTLVAIKTRHTATAVLRLASQGRDSLKSLQLIFVPLRDVNTGVAQQHF
jgi:hypothetical protein